MFEENVRVSLCPTILTFTENLIVYHYKAITINLLGTLKNSKTL